jgi:outer membrane protein OmpA-like peptidoglycan-associated protein
VTPELVGEIGGRHARLTLNVGARFRGTEAFNTLSIGHELIAGLGLGVPVSKAWEIDVEAFGATGFADFFKRQNSPVEALGGVRWRSENGWTAALAAGPGIARGYGSPDFRAVATVGWHQPAPKETVWEPIAEVAKAPPPPPPADWDKDGIIDTEDKCPRVPGPKENDGCALYVALVPDEIAPVEIVIMQRIEFDTDNSVVLPAGEVVLEEIRALLEVNPQLLKIAIEGHADERASDKYNMELSRRRSDAVKRWLTDHGIAADRLQSRGYGEREPFVSGTTPANQQTNRNVQFFITSPAASVPSR